MIKDEGELSRVHRPLRAFSPQSTAEKHKAVGPTEPHGGWSPSDGHERRRRAARTTGLCGNTSSVTFSY